MSKKVLIFVLFGFLCFNVIGVHNWEALGEQSKPITLKLALVNPDFSKIGKREIMNFSYAGMVAFKNSLEKSTSGRIDVQLYTHGRLGSDTENLQQALAGTIQGSVPSDGPLASFCPEIQLFSVPYLFSDTSQLYTVMDGPFMKKLTNDMAKKTGLRIVSSFANGGYRNFSNNIRPIRTAEDLKGLKMRTMNIPVHQAMMKALGASPTPVNWSELYSALQNKVVDGQENSPLIMLDGALQEVQKYYTLDGHLLSTAYIVISEKFYQSLPNDLKQAVLKAGQEGSSAARGTVRANDALAIQYLKDAGLQIYSPTSKELATFAIAKTPVIQWLKAHLDPKLVNSFLKEAARAKKVNEK